MGTDTIIRQLLAGVGVDNLDVDVEPLPAIRYEQARRICLWLEECGFSRQEARRLRFARWLRQTGRISG